MKLEVRDGGHKWSVESTGRVVIGTAPLCDLVLPRDAFAFVGRQEMSLEPTSAGLRLVSMHPEHVTTLDGKGIDRDGAPIAPGVHVITIDDKRLTLVISA